MSTHIVLLSGTDLNNIRDTRSRELQCLTEYYSSVRRLRERGREGDRYRPGWSGNSGTKTLSWDTRKGKEAGTDLDGRVIPGRYEKMTPEVLEGVYG